MDRFVFTDDLLTGLDDVDAQHRQLFDLANRVVEHECHKGEDGQFFAALAFLSDYVQYHFAAEELAMKRASYPETELHQRAHQDFRELIGEFVEVSLEVPNVAELSARLTEVISGWLTAHIRAADRDLARYLRRHALDDVGGWPNAEQLMAAGVIDDRTYAAICAGPKA
jgi:hemerythrin-like metal-binding protein